MDTKIIFSNSLKENEFLKQLAFFDTNCLNLRICNCKTLCDLYKSKANVFIPFTNINVAREELAIFGLIKKNSLANLFSYADVKNITRSFNNVRSCLISEHPEDEFSTKLNDKQLKYKGISLIHNLFDIYENALTEVDCIDDIIELEQLIPSSKKVFDELVLLNEEIYNPLEVFFAKSISKKITYVSICDLLPNNKKQSHLIATNYYGVINEIKGTLNYILKNNIPFDQTCIYLANSDEYNFHLYNLSKQLNIPMTFSCGIPIKTTNVYKVFSCLMSLKEFNFTVEGYKRLFNLEAFKSYTIPKDFLNPIIELFGNLKITFNSKHNSKVMKDFRNSDILGTIYDKRHFNLEDEKIKEFEETVNRLIEIFNKGPMEVVNEFADFSSDDDIEFESFIYIDGCFRQFIDVYSEDPKVGETYLKMIGNKNVYKSFTDSASIAVCELKNVNSIYRPHTFILGLSADNFPGKPIEDFLCSDECYKKLNPNYVTSKEVIKKKLISYDSFINCLKNNCDEIILSYSFFNMLEVKDANPSSVIFNLLPKNPKDESIIKNGNIISNEFDENINLYKAYLENNLKIKKGSPKKLENDNKPIENFCLTPSKLTTFDKCKLAFYFESVLKIAPEKENDIFDTFPANEFGNCFHKIMEHFKFKNKPSKLEFLSYGKSVTNDYLKYFVPFGDPQIIIDEMQEFLSNSYDFVINNNFDIIKTEEPISGEYITNNNNKIKLFGYIDAIVKQHNIYKLLDYKTGKKLSNKENEPITLSQLYLYSYLLEKSGIKNAEGIYFYPRHGIEVLVDRNLIDKNAIDELLDELFESIKTKDFTPDGFNKKESMCVYCSYAKLCPHNNLKKEDGDDE